MPIRLPPLISDRLIVREFAADDLDDLHRILDGEVSMDHNISREERQKWMEWTIAGYEQYAAIYQPPYGERAITLKTTGELIGAIGLVPMLHPLGDTLAGAAFVDAKWLPEVGLYYALTPAFHRHGFATEAAQILIAAAFENLNLKRVVANTEFDNAASIGVMKKLGMSIHKNDGSGPDWFEVLGVLEP